MKEIQALYGIIKRRKGISISVWALSGDAAKSVLGELQSPLSSVHLRAHSSVKAHTARPPPLLPVSPKVEWQIH